MLTWAEKGYFEHLFEKQAILSILFERKAILTHKSISYPYKIKKSL